MPTVIKLFVYKGPIAPLYSENSNHKENLCFMKKENRHLAQQRRAAERKKQAQMKKIKKFLTYFIPGLAVLILVVVLIVDGLRNSGSEDSQEEETTQSASAEDSDTGTQTTLSTDSSLTIADGDTVNIDYVGSIDGVELDGGSTQGQGTDLTIGSGSYIDDFEEQLIGAHPGDTVNVYATFPVDYGKEDLNGKEALFVVTVNGIYQ